MSVNLENGDDMVGVLFRFQIENQWWKTDHPQRGRGKNSALKTRRSPIAQNFLRRSRSEAEIVRQIIEKSLNARRSLKRT